MKTFVLIAVIFLFLTGCASYVVKDGAGNIIEQGDAYGFGRDLTHVRTTTITTTVVSNSPVTQTIITDSTSSSSNVASVLSAANGVLGTLIAGGEKAAGAAK